MSRAQDGQERFEIFDDAGRLLGLAPREEVHRRGLWHRSADVWVFDADGRLLLQRRSGNKDLFPGCWDYSVGEHLRPEESYRAGAQRGLREELGIVGGELTTRGGLRRVCTRVPERQVDDRELARSFVLLRYAGSVCPDSAEVAELRWMQPSALARWMALEAAAFTPWLIQAGRELGLIPSLAAGPA